MRIGIDFHSAEREGSGNCTYIRNLVEAMTLIDGKNEFFLYVTDRSFPYYGIFKDRKNVHLRQIPFNNPFIRIPSLGLATFKDAIDVLHIQYIAPPIFRGKMVVVIHDLAYLHFPQCFRRFERFRLRHLIPINARMAKYILTVSEYSKNDLVKTLQIPEDKIIVSSNGLDKKFGVHCDEKDKEKILQKYGISGKYILSVGRLDPRKNLLRLINAFKELKKSGKLPHKLVIIGKEDHMSSEIENAVRGFENEIIKAGYISDEHLPCIYQSADLFVYPTLFEGFGLPVLEAMACGCPVIASNVASIPEVAGDAAVLVDPESTEEIMNAIDKVVNDRDLRSKMIEKGLKQASGFSWETSARITLDTYERAIK